MNSSCSKVVPSHQILSDWQKTGLKLTSSHQGRDVVLAIDLTGSVRLNDEGRLRLKQIIQDSLHPGDAGYVVPFASTVNPLQPQVDCLYADAAIPFKGKLSDFVAACFGFDDLGEDFADGVEYACVGDGIRSRGAFTALLPS